MFELDVNIVNSKGDRVEKEAETEEAAAEKLFKNYVYELVFQDIEKSRQDPLREMDIIIEEHRKERAIRRK